MKKKIINIIQKIIRNDYWLQSIIVDCKSLIKAIKECDFKPLF